MDHSESCERITISDTTTHHAKRILPCPSEFQHVIINWSFNKNQFWKNSVFLQCCIWSLIFHRQNIHWKNLSFQKQRQASLPHMCFSPNVGSCIGTTKAKGRDTSIATGGTQLQYLTLSARKVVRLQGSLVMYDIFLQPEIRVDLNWELPQILNYLGVLVMWLVKLSDWKSGRDGRHPQISV